MNKLETWKYRVKEEEGQCNLMEPDNEVAFDTPPEFPGTKKKNNVSTLEA